MNHAFASLIASGPVIWCLCAFSIVAMSIILFKLWQFFIGHRLLDVADIDKEIANLIDNPQVTQATRLYHPRLKAIDYALSMAKQNTLPFHLVKEDVFRFARSLINLLNRQLRTLEIIASLAPLLGLFGTVLGMIEAFKAMELAGSQVDPSVLSAGIWQALSTTAVGLGVAIPVALVHGWFERLVEVLAQQLQDDLEQFFTALASKPPVANNIQVAA